MKIRLAGKIACGCLCVVFVLLALIYATEKDMGHLVRGVLFAVLSLTSAIGYRYFEY